MQSSRFQSLASKLAPSSLRTTIRNRSASSSTTSSMSSISSNTSAAETINSVIFCQPSIVNMEAERRSFGSELGVLEPRPIVYWGSLEERMEGPAMQSLNI